SFTLKDAQFRYEGKPKDVVTTDKPRFYPLAPRVEGTNLDSATWQLEQVSPREVRLHTEQDGLAITRKVEAGTGPYQVWITTTLRNTGTQPRKLRVVETTHHYVERHAESGGVPLLPARSAAISRGLCHHNGSLEHADRSKLLEAHEYKGNVQWTGVDDAYFLNAIVATGKPAESCRLWTSDRGRDSSGDPTGALFETNLRQPEVTLAPGAQETQRVLAYLGPKTPEALGKAGYSLHDAIESGWFTSLAHGLTALLSFIHSVVPNWGIAIILLTFLVKLVLYPLTHKQMASMARMKELKPEMDRINEQYADDREKKGAAIMELYRKKGVNPMAGCFPVLLQLPIWFSLYASLSSNIRLLHAPFALWWRDLSSPDPYFVLPLALGILMFVQQKMTPPAGADPLQAKMMLYVMPVMITSFMLFLPAGLCLYMFTNSALSIVQQRYIESRLKQTVPATLPPASSTSVKVAKAEEHADATLADSKDKPAQRRLRRGRK
ncbi:MAG TPA: membrane protein insertase YidC, partial [Polyangiales bacterium]|nr:membrane protein insertase YidC [Polyangiales bacterium]